MIMKDWNNIAGKRADNQEIRAYEVPIRNERLNRLVDLCE